MDLQPVCTKCLGGVIDHIEETALTVIDAIEPKEWLEKNRLVIEQVELNEHHALDTISQAVLLMMLYNLREFVQLRQNFLNRLTTKKEQEEFYRRHHHYQGEYANKLIQLQQDYASRMEIEVELDNC